MNCYFQGCTHKAVTKEHIPPKSFFPLDQRNQLLTVPSCEKHNNAKSSDDTYVLAHICMNASPANGAREVFLDRIGPQLGYNQAALRKVIAKGAVPLEDGAVSYPVNVRRFDEFFTALSCGIIFKACKKPLPKNYRVAHVYHNFQNVGASPEELKLYKALETFYTGEPAEILNFGAVKTLNTSIYSAKIWGVKDFGSSITVVHEFFGRFRVTSLLTNTRTAAISPL